MRSITILVVLAIAAATADLHAAQDGQGQPAPHHKAENPPRDPGAPVSPLDGHAFDATLDDKPETLAFRITFSGKEMRSDFFDDHFSRHVLTVAVTGKDPIQVTAKVADPGGTLTFKGTVKDHVLTGTFTLKPNTGGDGKTVAVTGRDVAFPAN